MSNRSKFRGWKSKSETYGRRVALIRGLIVVGYNFVQVDAGLERAVQKPWLGEAQLCLLADRRKLDARAKILSQTEKISLGVAELSDEGTRRRIPGPQRELASGLLRHANGQVRAIGLRTRRLFDVDVLEETE